MSCATSNENRTSLLIVFDDIRWANLGLVWILARIAQTLPLPEEVPALIQLDFHLMQALHFFVAEIPFRVEALLFLG